LFKILNYIYVFVYYFKVVLIIQDYSGQHKNRQQIINNKLLLIVLFGKLYKLYGHGLEIMGRRQTSIAGPKYIHLKSTCDVNLLSKLSIIFKEWRVMNNVDRGGARV
jgi:hypothetical protein